MFNKIRKMMKNEKGFTLVELLAVIVILGIIVAIAIPAIGNVISNARDNADDAEISMIVDAARLYEVQNEGIGADGVTVGELVELNYIEKRQSEFEEDFLDKAITKVDGEYLFDGKVIGEADDEDEIEEEPGA